MAFSLLRSRAELASSRMASLRTNSPSFGDKKSQEVALKTYETQSVGSARPMGFACGAARKGRG
jgi:hypothetical protein